MKRFNIKLSTDDPKYSITLLHRDENTWEASKWVVDLFYTDSEFVGIKFRGYGVLRLGDEIAGRILTSVHRDINDDAIVLTLMRKS